jgi:hypothetical protein
MCRKMPPTGLRAIWTMESLVRTGASYWGIG